MIERSRWVFDTSALVSRLLVPSGTTARAVDVALAHGVLLFSEATLAELAEVLWRPNFDPYLDNAQRRQFFSLLAGGSRSERRQVSRCGAGGRGARHHHRRQGPYRAASLSRHPDHDARRFHHTAHSTCYLTRLWSKTPATCWCWIWACRSRMAL